MINNKDELAFEFVKALWDSLDFTNIKGKRMMGIWDEFIAKIKICLNTENTVSCFCNKFCKKFETKLSPNKFFSYLTRLDKKEQEELLHCVEENLHIIIVQIRLEREENKNAKN
jgi:hypothetical protein